MESKNFVRSDSNKGAIINIDNEGLSAYKRQRQLLRDNQENDIRMKKIESSLEELKSIVLKIANGK